MRAVIRERAWETSPATSVVWARTEPTRSALAAALLKPLAAAACANVLVWAQFRPGTRSFAANNETPNRRTRLPANFFAYRARRSTAPPVRVCGVEKPDQSRPESLLRGGIA